MLVQKALFFSVPVFGPAFLSLALAQTCELKLGLWRLNLKLRLRLSRLLAARQTNYKA